MLCLTIQIHSAETAEGHSTKGRCPVDWIRNNGVCVDNIKLGRSTIEKAGRGAFAKRFIPAGNIIAPIPLLHVLDKNVFNLHSWKVNEEGERVLDAEIAGKQLLVNYCFGHMQSTLLFCQTTNTALINHKNKESCSEVTCGEQPNARIRWSEWDPSTKKWLSMSLDELAKVSTIVLLVSA